jgi:hypothetical protein
VSDTTRDRGLSVTIKYDKNHDATWAVFQGSPEQIREDIGSYFGFDRDTVASLSLHGLVIEATNVAHGTGLIASKLGATVVKEEPNDRPATPSNPQGDPWAEAASSQPATPAAQPAPDPNAWIKGEIDKQTTLDGLKRLWAGNQAMFADKSVMDAYKVRGQAIKAATA